jgi:broad specificity phosphatase PhoE
MEYKDGTQVAGFVHNGENKSPRECGNCVWMGLESCGHPLIKIDPQVPHNDDGRGIVDSDDCCDNFQSRKNALIYCIRHGDTEFNDKHAFRGWINVPLNDKGKEQAKLARKYLETFDIKQAYTSDLSRAVATSKLVLPSKRAEKNGLLRPWDVGVFSGKEKDVYQSALNHYIDNPEITVPDGESLNDFAKRMKQAFDKYVAIAKESGPIALFFHSSNCIQFEKIAGGKDETGRPEDVELISPGGILAILDSDDGTYKAEPIFGATKQANYGS